MALSCVRLISAIVVVFLLLSVEPLPARHALPTVHVIVSEDLFGDTPKETAETSAEPFRKLMEQRTGYSGKVMTVKTAFDIAKQLDKKQTQLGVFEGFELAWVKADHPDLRPLVIAVNQQQRPRALVVVPKNSPAKTFADLKGKVVDQPLGTKGYVRLFVRQLTQKLGQTPKQFFAKIEQPGNVEDALDDAVDNMVPVVVTDSVAFDAFQKRKPGRALGLRVLTQSPPFPAVVVVYRTGTFEDAALARFREALLSAADNPDGRRVLTLWKLTAFEAVPADYAQQLNEIRQAYPPPKQTK